MSLEIPRARGNLKKHIFKESNCELKLEFQGDYRGGGEGKPKKPSVGGMQIFSGTTHVITLTGFGMFFCS